MYRPIALYIGLRYTRAKRRNHFISFIGLVSMLGIALGVAALITVLSVMNGFDQQIKERVFSMAYQVTLGSYEGSMPNWQAVNKKVGSTKGIQASAPYIFQQAMLTRNEQVHPALVFGILPSYEKKVSALSEKMISGSIDALKPGGFGIILGEELAASLGVGVGDKITLVAPVGAVTPMGIMPRFKRFTVTGLFSAGRGFGFDSDYSFIHLQDAQTLYQLGDKVSGLRFKLDDLYQAPKIADELVAQLPPSYTVGNWTVTYGAFFQAIALEKTMMFIVLSLIILVAAFNLVASLVMVVTDKQSDIAILRTLGCPPGVIMRIFMVQGSLIGMIGTVFGLVGGLLLAFNVTTIVSWLQGFFGVNVLASSAYYVDYLPSKVQGSDVLWVCIIALGMSLIATVYPAWRASKVHPAEALRYE
jgi:lipoprotein-releasing system permease protein